MSSALPQSGVPCCTPACDEPVSIQVPGATGATGAAGTNGTNGTNPFTTFTVAATIPAELANVVATVADTSWMVISQKVYASRADGSVHAFFEVMAISGATSVTLKNLEDTPNSAYLENSAPGATLNIGSKLIPAGIQGTTGLLSGSAAGGDLKGTYPNPKIGIANTLGASLWGNGTDTVSVPAGTNGHMLAYDSTDAEGVKSLAALPLTGGTDVSINRVSRLSATTGLPIPVASSKAQINDPGSVTAGQVGALVLDASAGNARGTDAVDLQVAARSSVAMVASGNESFLGGGDDNTVSGARGVCCGGDSNLVSSTEGFVGGGEGNQAITGDRAGVCCGQTNVASGTESFIGGGEGNAASAAHATIAGGQNNTATAQDSTVGGGFNNDATAAAACVAGGDTNVASGAGGTISGGASNTASATYSTISGGTTNAASGPNSIIPGGSNAVADKHGQLSHAAGQFAAAGDAQTFELVLRRATTDATASELFLDGASLRAAIPTNTTWAFHLHTVARDDQAATAESAAWEVKGSISNDNGTTALVAAVTSVTLADDTGGTWVHAVTADNVNDALIVTVTGEAARNIRWVCHMRIVQVTY